ncbi:LrgB family protein [Ornithinibacillus halotolerans]|uniref:LrgB family protein n=1 Tax=Ornithinibacillus halotolerans TaxID=1274357 RepID=A0A916W943_9BACI|nr:LrgB family protein [Ornithinibacillus halotolerans]GGA79084.1 hypothetical protein GCM10008025_23150 [Ornithinibacillus halotolerans]
MNNIVIGVIGILGIVIAYLIGRWLNNKFPSPFTIPILIATVVLVSILLLFGITYETFMIGGKWVNELLGPSVVALAYPLYLQRKLLKKYFLPIFSGVFIGALIGVVSGLLLAKWMNVDEFIVYSLVPKSVTTPVAMNIAESLGGVPPLAAVFVMIAGIGGAVLGPIVFRIFRIHKSVAKGVGLGSASHAIGTSTAMEHSQQAGAVSTVAMVLSAIIVSILTPILVGGLY